MQLYLTIAALSGIEMVVNNHFKEDGDLPYYADECRGTTGKHHRRIPIPLEGKTEGVTFYQLTMGFTVGSTGYHFPGLFTILNIDLKDLDCKTQHRFSSLVVLSRYITCGHRHASLLLRVLSVIKSAKHLAFETVCAILRRMNPTNPGVSPYKNKWHWPQQLLDHLTKMVIKVRDSDDEIRAGVEEALGQVLQQLTDAFISADVELPADDPTTMIKGERQNIVKEN